MARNYVIPTGLKNKNNQDMVFDTVLMQFVPYTIKKHLLNKSGTRSKYININENIKYSFIITSLTINKIPTRIINNDISNNNVFNIVDIDEKQFTGFYYQTGKFITYNIEELQKFIDNNTINNLDLTIDLDTNKGIIKQSKKELYSVDIPKAIIEYLTKCVNEYREKEDTSLSSTLVGVIQNSDPDKAFSKEEAHTDEKIIDDSEPDNKDKVEIEKVESQDIDEIKEIFEEGEVDSSIPQEYRETKEFEQKNIVENNEEKIKLQSIESHIQLLKLLNVGDRLTISIDIFEKLNKTIIDTLNYIDESRYTRVYKLKITENPKDNIDCVIDIGLKEGKAVINVVSRFGDKDSISLGDIRNTYFKWKKEQLYLK